MIKSGGRRSADKRSIKHTAFLYKRETPLKCVGDERRRQAWPLLLKYSPPLPSTVLDVLHV